MRSRLGIVFGIVALSLTPGLKASVVVVSEPGYGQRGTVSHGVASQSYLGVDVRDVAEDQVSVLKLKEARGAEIIRVDHDGPAGKMGLRDHDVVVQMNGTVIEGEEQIRRMMHETPPGRAVVLLISRDGQQMTVTAQMADRNEVERRAWEQHVTPPVSISGAGPQAPATGLPGDDEVVPAGPGGPTASVPGSRYGKSFMGTLLTTTPTYTGVMLERMSAQLATFFGAPVGSGLLVRSVAENSPAAMAGLKAGDVVVRANSRGVGTMTDWAKTIHEAKGRPVTVVVMRDRVEKTFTLTPDGKKRTSLELPDHVVMMARLTEL